MGFGVLNVWIHDQFSPCKISDEFWYANSWNTAARLTAVWMPSAATRSLSFLPAVMSSRRFSFISSPSPAKTS